jgi:hypothetical protein
VTHLRKLMLEELQRRNYSEETIRSYIHAVEDFSRRFDCPPDRLGPRHIREYQAELFQKRKLSSGTVVIRLAALRFFYTKTLRMERRRHSLSKKEPSPAGDPPPGRSRSTHRRGLHCLPSHAADDALRYRSPQRRVDAAKVQRCRQQADGDSHARRQGTHKTAT